MNAKTIFKFLFGQADAIHKVASSRSAIWTGAALVLLTAFARNYDQTFILEKLIHWLLGPLIFSLVSGTWIFLICYGLCARRSMDDRDGKKPPVWKAWPSFMGLFWMTAPIAWLYALPVERFFDSLTATKLNLALLAVVSFWRIALMTRVIQVICSVPYVRTLLWVLLAAAVEVLLIYVFGPHGFGRAILAGMAGLRNSPEEDVLLNAMALSAFVAMGIVPLTIVILAIWRWNGTATELPAFQSSRTPWIFLGLASVAWVTVTVPAQIQLCRNFTFERLVTDGEIRAALDYMGQHQLRDFAPARTLPPKLYEWDSAERLARLLGELRCDDSTWIHKHLLHGIKVIVARQKNWQSQRDIETPLAADEVSSFRLSHGPDGAAWLAILHALDLSEEGRAYKARQTNLWAALSRESKAPPVTTGRSRKSEATQHADWLRLGEILRGLGHTNAVTSLIDNSAP